MAIKSESTVQHYALNLLSDGAYAAIATEGGAAIANSGLVDLGGSTLVIDTTLTPTAAEALRADALRLTGRVPNLAVNTHYHNDHIWGNQVFLPEADIISTVETRALIQTAGQDEYNEYRATAPERLTKLLAQRAAAETGAQRAALDMWIGYYGGLVRDFPRLQVTLPSLTFENRMVLHGSRRRAELNAFAGAHTGSDTVVILPDDGIVFMSDLLFVGFHPYLGDGDPDRWLAVLRTILDGVGGSANRFVPGHGPVGTRADVEMLVEYIQDCQRITRALAAEGNAGQTDVAQIPIPGAYAGWNMPRFFYANLQFLMGKYK